MFLLEFYSMRKHPAENSDRSVRTAVKIWTNRLEPLKEAWIWSRKVSAGMANDRAVNFRLNLEHPSKLEEVHKH